MGDIERANGYSFPLHINLLKYVEYSTMVLRSIYEVFFIRTV